MLKVNTKYILYIVIIRFLKKVNKKIDFAGKINMILYHVKQFCYRHTDTQ